MDFSKLEWIVSALEVIGRDEKARRFAYAVLAVIAKSVNAIFIVATLFATLFGLGSLFTGLAALLK